MAHTKTLFSLMACYREALKEYKKENPQQVERLVEAYSRRKFIKLSSLGVGALAVAPSVWSGSWDKNPEHSVAIIGGGIAGLTAAYELQKKNIPCVIYEADKRTGGRIKTKTDFVAGLTTDFGAEFVDSTHTDLLEYLEEFKIETYDIRTDTLEKDTFFYQGKFYSPKEVVKAYKKILPKIIDDQTKTEEDDAYFEKIDYTPLDTYFESLNGDTWFIKIIEKSYESEYGSNISEQSAINFLSMMLPQVGKTFEVFGQSDEALKIKGGSTQLVEALTEKVKDKIKLNYKLTAIKQKHDKYHLFFENGEEIKAHYVLMTLPFTLLRSIPLEINEMTENKKKCIQDLGYGTNVKLIQKFDKKTWREQHCQGFLFNNIIHNGFDSSQFQNNNQAPATYTLYFGGDDAMALCDKSRLPELRNKYIKYLDTIYKGSLQATENHTEPNQGYTLVDWPKNPYSLCSYSSFKPGQWTLYGEEVRLPVGNLYFAGEQCSDENQGFMNGAIETAKSAVKLISEKIIK